LVRVQKRSCFPLDTPRPKVEVVHPQMLESVTDVVVLNEHEDVELFCKVDANPLPTEIAWLVNVSIIIIILQTTFLKGNENQIC